MSEYRPYNPLDKSNLGVSVADALLAQEIEPLPPAMKFDGAGVYALYYLGDFEPYSKLVAECPARPIYIGKADPPGSRTGMKVHTDNPGPMLHKRLKEHAKSIDEAENLHLADFRCRYLAVDDVWIPLGESLLIARFTPIWNYPIVGFGMHDTGKKRADQARSPWDVVHPGRSFAEKQPLGEKPASHFVALVKDILSRSTDCS